MVTIINIFIPNEDTFYSTLRPLALFSKVLGMFPLQNAVGSEGRDLAYHWLSIATLWGPLLHYSTHALYYFLETSPWWRLVIPFVNVPRAILFSVSSLIEDRHLTKLITNIEEFDVKYNRISRKCVKSCWRKYLGVIWMFVSLASFAFYVTSEMYFTRPADSFASYILAITDQVNVVPRMLYLNMFMFFCQSLAWRFEDVRDMWRETVVGIGAEFLGQRDGEWARLEDTRLLHHDLAMAVKVLNKCYGLRLAIYFAIVVIEIIQDFFFALYLERSLKNLNQILFTAYNFVVLGSVTHFAGKLADTANGIRDEFGGCRVTSLPLECRQQVQLFATCRSEVHVSAAGFCDVDRSLMVSVLVSISTYFLVVVQFDTQIREFTSGYLE